MVQHINLLPVFKAQKGLTKTVWAILVIWVFGLGGMAVKSELDLRHLQNSEIQARKTLSELNTALEKKRQDTGVINSAAMAKQIALMQSQLDARRDFVDLIQKGELGNPSGYSQWFETLASVHVDGVWLQGLDITKGGQSVTINGKSLGTDAVMRYIEQVNEAFKPMNVHFSSMEITQDTAAVDAASPRPVVPLSFKIF